MGLYRRKNSPNWYMAFTCDGLTCNASTGTEDEKTAAEIFRRLEAKIALGQWHPEMMQPKEEKQQYTFEELAEKFGKWAAPRQKSWNRTGRTTVVRFVKLFGDFTLNSFNTNMVEQFQSDETARGQDPGSVNRIVNILKSMFGKAVEWEMIGEDILKKVRKAKNLKGAAKRLRYLSINECHTLIAACDPHLKPIVITALNTGMRRGEILNIEWDKHVDLKHGFILLTEDITKNGTRREIPINDVLRAVLQGLTRRLDVSYVFFDPATGKPYGDIKKSWASAKRRAGIKDYHFHDNRHTFASQLVMAGVDITTVSKLLGHKSLTMTLRYAHLSPEHHIEAVRKIGELFTELKSGKNLAKTPGKEVNYCNFTEVNVSTEKAVSATN